MSNTNKGNLGGHTGLPPGAKSKHEVAALLCSAAADAGFWPIPEYEIRSADGCIRHIDVVWGTRKSASGGLWRPVAAFEIEGWGVARAPESVIKDIASLAAAAVAGAKVTAIVLFQVGPGGIQWRPRGTADKVTRLLALHGPLNSHVPIEVVLDESLEEKLPEWIRIGRDA